MHTQESLEPMAISGSARFAGPVERRPADFAAIASHGVATSPSAVIQVFVREIGEELPSAQSEKLEAHRSTIAKTTSHHDGRRARRCAEWAIDVAGDRDLRHPRWHEIKEAHAIWRDMFRGAEWAAMTAGVGRPAPLKDIEIEWVEDAVEVAKLVGEADGWEHAPWESLLVELIAMEPTSHRK